MSVVYRQMRFNDKIVVPAGEIEMNDDDHYIYDVWSGLVDFHQRKLYINDVVEYDGNIYNITYSNGETALKPLKSGLAWYDEVQLTAVVAGKCIKRTTFWEYMAYEYNEEKPA